MGKTEKKTVTKKQGPKAVPKAPLAATGAAGAAQTKKSPLFEKRPRNFRIGGSIRPKTNLTRFVKWPQYIRLQRQKRILMQRLKVPPAIAQFEHTLDKAQMSQVARLCSKMAPETKAEKKLRLKEMAGKKPETTDGKGLPVLKFGLNHVTELVESKKAKLVLIAHDVDPIELVVWLPALCRKKGVAYCIVKGKSRLGQLVGKKTASCVAITTCKEVKELDAIVETCTAAFNDNRDVQRKVGGGLFGRKSEHIIQKRQAMLDKELAKKTGLAI